MPLKEKEKDETIQNSNDLKDKEEKDSSEEKEMNDDKSKDEFKKTASLQLGDIIKLQNPYDDVLNMKTFYISYIDEKGVEIVNVDTMESISIPIHQDGVLGDGRIKKIELLKRNKDAGYARQHGLVPGIWINITFGGDVPSIVTGEITNLEEDMIELRLYPDDDIIYINFDYKGIPKDLLIDSIEIRVKPSKKQEEKKQVLTDETVEDIDFKESVLLKEREEKEDEKVNKTLKDYINQGNQIKFSHEFFGQSSLPNDETVQIQTNDLLQSLLNDKQLNDGTTRSLVQIQTMVNRFLELREKFSVFDSFGKVTDIHFFSLDPKPLTQYFENFDQELFWIIPVVKHLKKLYLPHIGSSNDYIEQNFYHRMRSMEKLWKQYESNQLANKYSTFQQKMNELLIPFDYTDAERNDSDILIEKKPNTDITAIVSNFDGFASSVIQNNQVHAEQFVRQKYDSNDVMEIISFLTLPVPFVRFSRINLPMTSILEKCNLNLSELWFWKLFKKDLIVQDVYLSNLDGYLDYNADNFANNIKNFIPNLQDEKYKSLTKAEIYRLFVKTMIPRTKVLFDIMKQFVTKEFTITEAIQTLEPFLVYPENITSLLLPEMETFLKEQIHLYNKRLAKEFHAFSALKKLQSSKEFSVFSKSVLDILERKNQMKEDVIEAYALDPEKSNASNLLKIYRKDYGRLFTNAVTLSNIPLMFPKELTDLLESEKKEEEKAMGKKEKTDLTECNGQKVLIAKIYKDEKSLLADNDNEIFFDKVFDKTNYAILDDYETEMQTMTPEDFIEFLPKALDEKYQIGKEEADYLADTLIAGIKRVTDGQYAIINLKDSEDKNKSDIFYFKRVNNQWELDEEATKTDVVTTDEDIFCNLQEKCIAETKEIESNNSCESIQLNKVQLKEDLLNEMLDEFDRKYYMSKEKFTKTIQENYDNSLAMLPKLDYLKKHERLQYNNQMFRIGFKEDENEPVVLQSPYQKQLQLILASHSFVQRQHDICNFAREFTREAYSTGLGPLGKKETKDWLYCMKTNVPLLPTFLLNLAACFVSSPYNYVSCLWSIIRDQGICKNSVWTDKKTGYVISTCFAWNSFSFESRENICHVPFTKIQLVSSNEIKVITKALEKVEKTISLSLGQQRDFILCLVSDLLNSSMIMSETEYNKKALSSDKKMITFYLYYQRNLLYFLLASVLVAIQVATPDIRTRKTFPGCVRCFHGYPFDSNSTDMSSVNYLASIAFKLRQGDEPWSAFRKMDKEGIVKGVKYAIDNGLLKIESVKRKMREKQLFLSKRKREKRNNVKEEWHQMLPPLVPIHMTHLVNVSPEFKSTLSKDLKYGSNHQRNKIGVLESKIAQFSLAIQEKINEIVRRKLEVTHLMVSCCEDVKNMESYSQTIKEYNDIVTNLANVLRDIQFSYVQCEIWNSSFNTQRVLPALDSSETFNERTRLLGLIDYCNFRNFCPIPDELVPLCESKPSNIKMENSTEDVMLKIKEDKLGLNEETFQRMVQLVSRRNIIEIPGFSLSKDDETSDDVREKDEDKFLDSLKQLDAVTVASLQKWFIQRDKFVNEKKEENELILFFINKNENMKKEVFDFLNKHKNCYFSLDSLKHFLSNLLENKTNLSCQKILHYIHHFGVVIPTLVVNEVDLSNNHFSTLHTSDMIYMQQSVSSILNNYRKFYSLPEISLLFEEIRHWTKPLYELACLVNQDTFDEKERMIILLNILFHLFIHFTRWVNEEDTDTPNCALSKKDSIKMNNENLREFNGIVCDLLLTYLQEMEQENEFLNVSLVKEMERKREQNMRMNKRKKNLENTLEQKELNAIKIEVFGK